MYLIAENTDKLLWRSERGFDFRVLDFPKTILIRATDGIIEIQRRRGKKVNVCFMDMTAASDTVNRGLLIGKVRTMFKSDKLANIIGDLY